MNELALFAGAGGGILASHLLGIKTVCAVERDGYAAQVLAQRQNDGCLPPFPIWSDVTTFDGTRWRGVVDFISGGFPCQDISAAGRGAGIDGERSGLWSEFARIIGEVRPRFVFVENSPMLTSRGLGRVLGDLAALGLDAQWGVLGAADVGAPHQRDRIWILAYSEMPRQQENVTERIRSTLALPGSNGDVANPNSPQRQGNERAERGESEYSNIGQPSWWEAEPDVGRVVDELAHRVDRLKALGNGQVPAVARAAILKIAGRL